MSLTDKQKAAIIRDVFFTEEHFKYCKEKLYPSEILVGVNNEYKNLLHLVISANLTASKYEGLRAKREDLDRQ